MHQEVQDLPEECPLEGKLTSKLAINAPNSRMHRGRAPYPSFQMRRRSQEQLCRVCGVRRLGVGSETFKTIDNIHVLILLSFGTPSLCPFQRRRK